MLNYQRVCKRPTRLRGIPAQTAQDSLVLKELHPHATAEKRLANQWQSPWHPNLSHGYEVVSPFFILVIFSIDAEASPPLDGAVPLTCSRYRSVSGWRPINHNYIRFYRVKIPNVAGLPYFFGHETNIITTLSWLYTLVTMTKLQCLISGGLSTFSYHCGLTNITIH